MAKKWNKVIARIQALEDALTGLLSGTFARNAKRGKAKATSKRKAPIKKPARKKAAKPVRAASPSRKVKSRKAKLRIAVAENAPILPQAPLLSL